MFCRRTCAGLSLESNVHAPIYLPMPLPLRIIPFVDKLHNVRPGLPPRYCRIFINAKECHQDKIPSVLSCFVLFFLSFPLETYLHQKEHFLDHLINPVFPSIGNVESSILSYYKWEHAVLCCSYDLCSWKILFNFVILK